MPPLVDVACAERLFLRRCQTGADETGKEATAMSDSESIVTDDPDDYYVRESCEFAIRSRPGFMNRRRLCQLTAAILTSDLTTGYISRWVL